mgnify:CR=1 FL=1
MENRLELASRIEEVAVFRSGALVTRVAELQPQAWPEQLELGRLPLALDDGSVRVRLEPLDPADAERLPQPSDVRVEWAVPPLGEPIEPPSEAELRAADERIQRFEQRLSALEEESANFDRLTFALPARIEKEQPRPISAAAFASAADWVERAKLARAEETGRLRRELHQAREERARLQRQVAESRAERGVDEERVCKRVVVRLRGGNGTPVPARLRLDYQVPGACWRPTYVVRVSRDGLSANLALRALVAQHSGEPWERVRLVLSTADLQRRIELPVLKSQRIGRRQSEPPQRAWRAPPTGAESLFESLDSALATRGGPAALRQPVASAPVQMSEPPPGPELEPEPECAAQPELDACCVEERAPEVELKKERCAPPPAMRPPAPCAMPSAPPPALALSAKSAALGAPRRSASREQMKGAIGGARKKALRHAEPSFEEELDASEPPCEDGAPLATSGYVLEYHRLRVVAWDGPSAERGSLKPLTRRDALSTLSDAQFAAAERLARAAESLARNHVVFPVTTSAVDESCGSFDYAFRASGPVDVPNDGALHNVPLFAKDAPIETTLVVVPRESDQAVRVATLKNPLATPLLAGPAEVYLENEFLVTSRFATEPAGASIDLGLGVEPGLKVARNTHFNESTEGLLNGSLSLQHEVTIEVASRLQAAAQVEVRERLPQYLPSDKEVVIELGEVSPEWEELQQAPPHTLVGGKRWRFALKPGESRKLSYGYSVRIDSKNELVGGNRRD